MDTWFGLYYFLLFVFIYLKNSKISEVDSRKKIIQKKLHLSLNLNNSWFKNKKNTGKLDDKNNRINCSLNTNKTPEKFYLLLFQCPLVFHHLLNNIFMYLKQSAFNFTH